LLVSLGAIAELARLVVRVAGIDQARLRLELVGAVLVAQRFERRITPRLRLDEGRLVILVGLRRHAFPEALERAADDVADAAHRLTAPLALLRLLLALLFRAALLSRGAERLA
jgi:hypothetical protein